MSIFNEMKHSIIIAISLIFIVSNLCAQPELQIVSGKQDTVRSAQHFFRGMTVPNSQLSVNGNSFPVYATGAFAAEVRLIEGNNKVQIVARHGGKETVNNLDIFYMPAKAQQATSLFEIEQAELIPNVSMVYPGDVLRIKVKTLPGSNVSWLNGNLLEELPVSETNGMAGIYQGQYIIKENDPLLSSPVTVTLKSGAQSISKEVAKSITVIDPLKPLYVKSKGIYPYLNYSLGQDRLGGSKMGYISAGIDMKVLSKVDRQYKVQLSKRRSAWIPESEVENPATQKLFKTEPLTSSWSVYGDDSYDYVKISMSDKLPYRSFQEINPNKIIVDIFGVASNYVWITQLQSVKTIANVNYEQIEDDVLRIFIDLNNKQHWGYGVYYENSQLVIRVKHQPKLLQLKNLRIALDAGHGGEASGAVGTTGMKEKDVNLELVMMLKAELEKQGAIVLLTRSDDSDISMQERLIFLSQQKPDLLISIHNNAGGNPLTTKGTSTYYRHIGYRPLSTAILSKLLELDIKNFGNIGSFNFALSSPTEYPNVLVECLFMSSPEDEAKLADKEFKTKFVKKIIDGLKNFLDEAK